MFSWLFGEPLSVGTRAPDWTLPDEHGNSVSLGSLRGKNVVLVFYPGDDTPTCRQQLCEFRDQWTAARDRNTVVFGVNPKAGESHQKFQAKYHLPFPLLIDEGQKMSKDYKASGLIVRRTVYLIGSDGTIRFAQRGKPPVSKVLAAAQG